MVSSIGTKHDSACDRTSMTPWCSLTRGSRRYGPRRCGFARFRALEYRELHASRVSLVFTRAGGLVGVTGSYGPSVGAGISTSESGTVVLAGQDVLNQVDIDPWR